MKKNNHGALNFIVSITLFTVFALALTLVLLTGAAAFRGIAEESEARFNERTPLLYLSNRLRSAETVELGNISGTPALILEADEYFDVYIYHRNGYVHEHYEFRGDVPTRSDLGMRLFPAASMSFAAESPTLLRVTVNGRDVFANVEVVS